MGGAHWKEILSHILETPPDIILKGINGTVFAHQVVLASTSAFIKDLIKELQEPVLIIPDVSVACLNNLKSLLYKGEICAFTMEDLQQLSYLIEVLKMPIKNLTLMFPEIRIPSLMFQHDITSSSCNNSQVQTEKEIESDIDHLIDIVDQRATDFASCLTDSTNDDHMMFDFAENLLDLGNFPLFDDTQHVASFLGEFNDPKVQHRDNAMDLSTPINTPEKSLVTEVLKMSHCVKKPPELNTQDNTSKHTCDASYDSLSPISEILLPNFHTFYSSSERQLCSSASDDDTAISESSTSSLNIYQTFDDFNKLLFGEDLELDRTFKRNREILPFMTPTNTDCSPSSFDSCSIGSVSQCEIEQQDIVITDQSYLQLTMTPTDTDSCSSFDSCSIASTTQIGSERDDIVKEQDKNKPSLVLTTMTPTDSDSRSSFDSCSVASTILSELEQANDVELKRSNNKKHPEVICEVCGIIISKNNLKQHLEKHKLKKNCCICHESFKDKTSLGEHYAELHFTGTGPYECDICKTTVKRDIKLHLQRHAFDKIEQCEYCAKVFPKTYLLVNHIRSNHTKEEAMKCEICSKNFSSRPNLQRHLKTHATDRETFPCNQCPKSFSSRTALTFHLNVHAGIRPHQCLICSKSFNKKDKLKRHILNVHEEGNKVLNCQVCDYVCSRQNMLTKHMKFNHSEQNYANKNNHNCKLCHYKTYRKPNLEIHMKKHHCDQLAQLCQEIF